MDVVYRARDLREGRLVAIKVVEHPQSDLATSRFKRGTEIMLRVDHPALCRAFACGHSEGYSFAVMEDLSSPSLDVALAPGERLPWRRAARLVAGLCAGLGTLHARGSVHRDVKPSNLVLRGLGKRESLVLIDFDLAKSYGPNLLDSGRISRSALASAGLSQGQGLSGTPVYMTCERLSGKSATPDSDVFGAALVLHRLLAGSLPTTREDYESLMSLIAARRRPLDRIAGVPEPVSRILQRALAPQKSARYPSAVALAQDLIELEPSSERPTRALRAVTPAALIA
jgi:eukaryotic-like serine/threonine-protein kinase